MWQYENSIQNFQIHCPLRLPEYRTRYTRVSCTCVLTGYTRIGDVTIYIHDRCVKGQVSSITMMMTMIHDDDDDDTWLVCPES